MSFSRGARAFRQAFIIPILPCVFFAVVFSGCASIPRTVLEQEPSRFLERDPQIYVRLSGDALRDVARATGPGQAAPLSDQLMDSSTLDTILAKATSFGAGYSGIGNGFREIDAVMIGNFSLVSMKLGLFTNNEWKKTGDGGYKSEKYPVAIRPLEPGVLHIVSPASAKPSPGATKEAFPARFEQFAKSDIFVSLNKPEALLSGEIAQEAPALPVSAIALAGIRGEDIGGDRRYTLDMYMLMKDESTARIFKPVARFIWAAAAGNLFGEAIDIRSTALVLEQDMYVARRIETTASSLAAVLSSLLPAN